MNEAPPSSPEALDGGDDFVPVVEAQADPRVALLVAARDRFMALIDVRAPSECWPWLGGRCAGYGYFYVGGGRKAPYTEYAHRLALFYATGHWARVARHGCDNPICCNALGAAHLVWGSHAENSQDALLRGRAYVGEANSNAKLTEEIVLAARALRAQGLIYREIGARLGRSSSAVRYACTGGWPHV